MWSEEESRQRKQKEQDDTHATVDRYHEAQQMITGLSRGAYFASHFGVQGMVGAAGQWLQAGQAAGRLSGMSESSVDAIAGPAGIAIASLGALAMVTDRVSSGLSSMAEKAGIYSPDVATAKAGALILQTEFNIEQAKKYGAVLGEFTLEKERLGIETQRSLNQAFAAIAPALIDAMKGVETLMAGIRGMNFGGFDIKHPLESLQRIITDGFIAGALKGWEIVNRQPAIQNINEYLKAMKDAMEGAKPNPVDEWMAANEQLELADLGMQINAVVQKEVGNPAVIIRGVQ